MGSHLIPFLGRKYSGMVNQNLLWQSRNVYLMDNHRAALWCWQQSLDLYAKPHNIFHIDRHTDALGANLQAHIQAMPNLKGLSIHDYLDAKVQLGSNTVPLFRWDNYLSIHIASFQNNLHRLISADHDDGDNPDFPNTQRPRSDMLPENIYYWLNDGEIPWIVNIDLDYFFCPDNESDTEDNEMHVSLFSNDFIDSVFRQIKTAKDQNLVKVVTVCLTPTDYTPGWQTCIDLSKRVFDILGEKYPSDI